MGNITEPSGNKICSIQGEERLPSELDSIFQYQ